MPKEITISPGVVLNVLSETEVAKVIQAWLEVFAKKRKGCRINDFKWHLFSSDTSPSEEGDRAVVTYNSHVAEKYLVIDNDESVVFETDQRPDAVGLSDFYVCPENMAWTMAFTHEDGWLGPYFAKHPNYQQLEQENLAYIEKQKQIELAKSKGWC